MSRYKTIARWPLAACNLGNTDNSSEDTHDTLEQAEGVRRLLLREGFGGLREHFPLEVRIEPVVLTDMNPFERWWYQEGSGMAPKPGEDAEEHVHRICEIAWSNGAYIARRDIAEGRDIQYLAQLVQACRNPMLPDEKEYRGVRVPMKLHVDEAHAALDRITGRAK